MDFFATEEGVIPGAGAKNKKNKFGFLTTLLRTFRLLRILRVFRLFRMLKQLYLLATGFAEALSAVVWVSLMLFLCLYVCAIVLTRMCAPQYQHEGVDVPEERLEFGEEHFGTIMQSMFTLFALMAHPNLETVEAMFASVDSSGELTAKVESDTAGIRFFFMAFIVLGSWAMLSLLTGVMSEHMIEKSAARKAEMKEEAAERRKVFLKSL